MERTRWHLAGTTMFIGGNFATTAFGGIGLIGVNTTTGAMTVIPPSGLTGVTSVTSDGTRAFAAGRTVNGDVLLSLHPGGALTFIPLTLPSVGNPRFTHFRGRLYALGERDDVTLQSTGSPLEFSSAWRGTDGVIVWNTGASGSIQYHPFADPSPPNAPRNLTAQTSGNNVMLTWSAPAALSRDEAPAGMTSSYVVRAGSGPGLSNLADFDTGSLNTTLTAFAPDGTYYVRVHARNAFGVSTPSNEVQFTVGPPVCTTPPGAPGTLGVAVSGLSTTFTWGPAAQATSYILEAGAAPGGAELAVLNVGASLAFSASAPAGVYYVRVRGSNACGNGPASNDVMVTLGTPVVVPGPPVNLAFTRDGNVVTLTWGAPVTGGAAASYILEAGSAPGLSNLAIVPIAGTAIAATAPPGTYYVRVRGVNSAGQGPPSNEVTVVVGGQAPR